MPVGGLPEGGVTLEGVMLLVMLAEHVSKVPPALPVPLHWLTLTASAGLTLDEVATEQTAVEPPPVTEPLHWVTVAPVVLAGNGLQTSGPVAPNLPPPPPVPTHWLTVAAVTELAREVSELTLFVMLTRQTIRGGAASLAEPLHWVTLVTTSVDLVVRDVTFPPGHGPRLHWRVTVVVEPLVAPLMVLTTVTVQVSPVVAPCGVAPMLLHWLMAMGAALAGAAGRTNPAKENAPMTATRAITIVRHASRREKICVIDISVVLMKPRP